MTATFLTFLIIVLTAATTGAQGRLPFQKKQITLKSPTSYEKRISGHDPTGAPVYYDPKPRVVPLDVKSGKYALRWIGYDGKEKTILYQRHDAVDAVISASVSITPSGQYLYVYKIKNLPSSGQHLSWLALQTFASDVKPMPIGDGYVGQFSNNRVMRHGNWIGLSFMDRGAVVPGGSIEFKIISSAPAGLVECRMAGGKFGLIGVGEEMPQELENVLPIYEDWPRAYTVGPIESLKTLSTAEQGKYLLERLSQFRKLGWISANAFPSYERNLRNGNLRGVFMRADSDFRTGNITDEVHDMIQGMK